MNTKPHIQKIQNRISNLVKTAYVTLPDNDLGDYPTAQISYYGKVAYTQMVYPYGLEANAPTNTLMKLISNMGQEENTCAINYTAKERFKGKLPGEVVVGSPQTRSFIKFVVNGDINQASKANINASAQQDINVTAQQNINLTASQNALITANDLNVQTPKFTLNNGD